MVQMKSVIHSSCPSISSLPPRCEDRAFLVEATLPHSKAGVHRKGWQLRVVHLSFQEMFHHVLCLYFTMLFPSSLLPFYFPPEKSLPFPRLTYLLTCWGLIKFMSALFHHPGWQGENRGLTVYLNPGKLTWIQDVGHDRGLGGEIGGVTI